MDRWLLIFVFEVYGNGWVVLFIFVIDSEVGGVWCLF